jgi:uncharacterized membrane-anchored protein YjiN (DUF445 family)
VSAAPSNRGRNALIVCVLGLVAVETCLRLGIVTGATWKIVAAGFEAGTIGALADWFAVTALFRRVPIPFIGRHTDIIVRNRARLTAAIIDVVQNQWLTPQSVTERLGKFSLSQALLRYFSDAAHREQSVRIGRELLGRLASRIDAAGAATFMREILADELPKLEVAGPLGLWLRAAIERGDHARLFDQAVAIAGDALDEPRIRTLIEQKLAQAAAAYKDQGLMKRLFLGSAEVIGGLDYPAAAKLMVTHARATIIEARANPEHPLRKKFDALATEFAEALASNQPKAVALIAELQQRVADSPRLQPFLHAVVERLAAVVGAQANDDTSPLATLLTESVNRFHELFAADAAMQAQVDGYFRTVTAELVREHHAVIGDMVAASLDPEKLSDRALVAQIEERIGDDLQYIRLNGAVVGGLAGIAIASIKLLI